MQQQQQEQGNLKGLFPVDIMSSSFDPCCYDEDNNDIGDPIDFKWAGEMQMALPALDEQASESSGAAAATFQKKQEKKPAVITAKTKAIPVKKDSTLSIKDRPKRALSAYNLFFREERKKIGEETFPVGFEQAGKIIGARWKKITPQEKAHYERLAAHEKWRFNMAMGEWSKARMEAKSRAAAAAAAAESTEAEGVEATTSVSKEADREGRSCQDAIVVDSDFTSPKHASSSPSPSSSSSSMSFSCLSQRMQEEQVQPLSMHFPSPQWYYQGNYDNNNYNYSNSNSGFNNWSSPIHQRIDHGYQHHHLNNASGSNMNTPPTPQITSSTHDDLLLQAPVLEFQASLGSVGSFDLGSNPARRACFNESCDERNMHIAKIHQHNTTHHMMPNTSDESLLDDDDHPFATGTTSLDRDATNFFNNVRLNQNPINNPLDSTAAISSSDESQSHRHRADNLGWNMH
jgi:HMG (high mobility group) box